MAAREPSPRITVPMSAAAAKRRERQQGEPEEQTVVERAPRSTPRMPQAVVERAPRSAPRMPQAAPALPSPIPPPVPARLRNEADSYCVTQALPVPVREAPKPPRPFTGSEAVDQRLALFACAADRERAAALLNGLAAGPRKRAHDRLQRLLAAPSAERQGQLALAFGLRADVSGALRALWAEAGPALRFHVFQVLPPYLRSLFPGEAPEPPSEAETPPGLAAFAERLVREATR